MAQIPVQFNMLRNISPASDSWIVKVVVSHMWCIPHEYDPRDYSSVEMMVVDAEGSKIQLTVYRGLMSMYQAEMCEGVAEIRGRMASDEFLVGEQVLIVILCLVRAMVDMMGMLVAASSKREYISNGAGRKFITMELYDHTGKVELTLFDEYVDKVLVHLRSLSNSRSIVVVQFAAIGSLVGYLFVNGADYVVSGDHVIQNHLAATRVLIALLGWEIEGKVRHIGGNRRFISMKDDFLLLNPVKKDGHYVIWAKIAIILDKGAWWYLSCKCGGVVVPLLGLYRCETCHKMIMNVIPRFRLRVVVSDGLETTNLFLLDEDVKYLIRKTCVEVLDETEVENGVVSFEDGVYFVVKRVCQDMDIMRMFRSLDRLVTQGFRFSPLIGPSVDMQVDGSNPASNGVAPITSEVNSNGVEGSSNASGDSLQAIAADCTCVVGHVSEINVGESEGGSNAK
ncbi:hypothetical protein SESBI_26016 [Sesbania bispinosa]|nr:hypothetical protein SESBI_26016 [Sesbania bispinosa]